MASTQLPDSRRDDLPTSRVSVVAASGAVVTDVDIRTAIVVKRNGPGSAAYNWGTPAAQPLEKELKHAVFFRFKKDATPKDIKQVEEGFAALPSKIDAIKRFEWGVNNSPEKHSAGFTHCFMVTFDSEEGRAAYLPHPEHQAFVELLKPILDAPRVLDFWAHK